MKTTTIKILGQKKQTTKNKGVTLDFWKNIALQQQAIIHAKNRT